MQQLCGEPRRSAKKSRGSSPPVDQQMARLRTVPGRGCHASEPGRRRHLGLAAKGNARPNTIPSPQVNRQPLRVVDLFAGALRPVDVVAPAETALSRRATATLAHIDGQLQTPLARVSSVHPRPLLWRQRDNAQA
eukprot:gnl/TRDRNA2_/TRDRNA2_171497_c1_seq1.p2 gnl/TRDRNA2_/TRDRNA2_171497_c1~~gnl/TRDRNA2_/TRDRNA2_171497_c1_seq1.p2  ORF type:complete len:135 (+),score=11.65 gnl/TRDRNA2_/TRDRNA2_171497_c1_seq1:197-601(+)